MSAYTDNGFRSRKHYLQDLADTHGVPYDVVRTVADMLGSDEDFDGLVNEVQDMGMNGVFPGER
jgi:glycosidase